MGTCSASLSRRFAVLAALFIASLSVSGCAELQEEGRSVAAAFSQGPGGGQQQPGAVGSRTALAALKSLPVKGRAPKTGYARSQFGPRWTDKNTAMWGGNSLSTREDILSRDLTNVVCDGAAKPRRTAPPCVVQSGVLLDPYTGTRMNFVRGEKTSPLVPIEHAVALEDAWQKGAQQLTVAERTNLANDPLNLIATTQEPNSAKRSADAATWLPKNKAFRCGYVARQVAVKARYRLWVTRAEKEAIAGVLDQCPGQQLPDQAVARLRTAAA